MKQRAVGRRLFKAGLVVAFLSLAYGCVSVAPPTPSASNAAVAGASSGTDASNGPDVTIGPSKTKKPKRTPQPTATTPTDEPTNQPSDTTTPTDTPTGSSTDAPTDAPTDTPSAPAGSGGIHLRSLPIVFPSLIILPIDPKLDYTASPNYGEANLSAGFSPDPYSVGMTTGGNVDVSYLGSACSGFATSAPDLRINFGGGGASLLRIYFIGTNGDSTIVINDPYGNYYCVDDSFGTVNATIDFNNPAGGSYDVWIGSYAANTTISGTLYLTENSGNHP